MYIPALYIYYSVYARNDPSVYCAIINHAQNVNNKVHIAPQECNSHTGTCKYIHTKHNVPSLLLASCRESLADSLREK